MVRTGTVILRLGFSDKITYAVRPFAVSKFYVAYNENVPGYVIKKNQMRLWQNYMNLVLLGKYWMRMSIALYAPDHKDNLIF